MTRIRMTLFGYSLTLEKVSRFKASNTSMTVTTNMSRHNASHAIVASTDPSTGINWVRCNTCEYTRASTGRPRP